MADSRSFGPVADQMSEALQRYSKEELIDLLTHIVQTYVVQGTLPLKPEVGTHSGDEQLAKLSFPQLILHHQMRLDHREWQLFSVSGEDVWVTLGGQRINLTERPSGLPNMPEPTEGYMEPMAGGPRGPRRQTPAAAGASGASGDHAPADNASRTAPSPAPSPPSAGSDHATNGAEGAPGSRVPEPFGEEIEASERFGMLEID